MEIFVWGLVVVKGSWRAQKTHSCMYIALIIHDGFVAGEAASESDWY